MADYPPLQKDQNLGVYNAPTIGASNLKRLSAAGAIDVTGAGLVKFDADADGLYLNYGSSSDTATRQKMLPGEAFTLEEGATSIYLSGACGYVLMGRQ